MNLISWLWLSLLIMTGAALESSTQSAYSIKDLAVTNPENTQVAVTKDLVCFLLQSKTTVCHGQTEFASGALANPSSYNFPSGYEVVGFESTADSVITSAVKERYVAFSIASKSSSGVSRYNNYFNMADYMSKFGSIRYSDSFMLVQFTPISSVTSKNYLVWKLKSSYGYLLKLDTPISFDIKDSSSDSDKAVLYFSQTTSSGSSSYSLKKYEITSYGSSSYKSSVTLGTNWADQITASEKIIVVVCTQTSPRMLSVYRENDLHLYLTKNDDSSLQATTVKVLSYDYYHRIFYNSLDETHGGMLGMLEVFVNRKSDDDIKTYTQKNLLSNSSYVEFAKYFDISPNNDLYVSSKKQVSDGNPASAQTLKVCSHSQVYSSASKTCSSVSSKHITIGLQDSVATACSDNDDLVEYNRHIGESVCDYDCKSYYFGKNCQKCSSYMSRVGADLGVYQKFSDSNGSVCSVTSDPNYCSAVDYCLACSRRNGWEYSNGSCRNSTSLTSALSLSAAAKSWAQAGAATHNSTLWGASSVDFDEAGIENLKPSVFTPKDTVCYWTLTSSSTINTVLSFSVSSMEDLYVSKISNGVEAQVTPNARNLYSLLRDLADLSNKAYSVTGASSVSILYQANADVTTGSFSSNTNATPTSSSSTSSSTSSSSSSSNSIILIIVVVVVPFVCIVFIMWLGFYCFFCKPWAWLRSRQENARRRHQIEGEILNNIGYDGALPVFSPNLVTEHQNYFADCNSNAEVLWNIKNPICSIWSEDFETNRLSTKLTPWNHQFHRNCIQQWMSSRNSNSLCPNWRQNVEIQ